MSSLNDTTKTNTNYAKFRLPYNVSMRIQAYYQLGLEALGNNLDEDPDNDPAFTMAILAESENVTNLTDCKKNWLNGWMDAYTNKYLRSSTN